MKNRLIKILFIFSLVVIFLYAPGCKQNKEISTAEIEENKSEKVEETTEESKEIMADSDNKESSVSTEIKVYQEALLTEFNEFFKETIKEYNLDSPYLLEQEAKNTWFPTEWVPGSYIRLINGEYREKYDNESATELVIRLTEFISFGDLNGDDINDAAVILVANPDVGDTFYYLYLLKNDYLYLTLAGTEFLGDSIKIKDLSIESGKILLRYHHS